MRLIALIFAFALFSPPPAAAQQDAGARAPFVVEQTYWLRPGKELQFISLFEKNRVPLLRAKLKDGGLLWVRLSRPRFNSNNEQWDLRVTAAWRDADSALEPIAKAKTQVTTEQQIMDELIVDRTDIPVQEWSVTDVAN